MLGVSCWSAAATLMIGVGAASSVMHSPLVAVWNKNNSTVLWNRTFKRSSTFGRKDRKEWRTTNNILSILQWFASSVAGISSILAIPIANSFLDGTAPLLLPSLRASTKVDVLIIIIIIIILKSWNETKKSVHVSHVCVLLTFVLVTAVFLIPEL